MEEQRKALALFFAEPDDDCTLDDLSAIEWKIVSELANLLESLESVTETISKSKSASISLIIPLISGLEVSIKSTRPTHDGVKEIRKRLLSSLEERFEKYEKMNLVLIGTLLDPRIKDSCFRREETRREASKALLNELEQKFLGWYLSIEFYRS